MVDLLLTDPPYNVNYKDGEIKNDNLNEQEFKTFLTQALANAYEYMEDGASFYIWYASREVVNFMEALKDTGLEVRQELIWNKNTFTLGRQDYQWKHEPCLYGWKGGASHYFIDDRTQTTILDFNKPIKNDMHPTMKPVELLACQIKNSTKEKDKVLDIFGGSGSTLIACEQLNRECYCMELEPKWVDVIIKRWETLTGQKAIKIN